ncbi:hypothetical protein [Peribacillus frigoritolerans]|jgi:hypothetical protein|uniref:hypothetical protein n=1 Tax=Peribacillus frigoritolerans TaxID=450367 RepID=UPI0039A1F381
MIKIVRENFLVAIVFIFTVWLISKFVLYFIMFGLQIFDVTYPITMLIPDSQKDQFLSILAAVNTIALLVFSAVKLRKESN